MRRFIKEIVLSIGINAFLLRGLSSLNFWIQIQTHTAGEWLPELQTYLLLGLFFWIINCLLKQLLHLVTFPLKNLTFGIIGSIINVGVLYFFQRFINTNYWDQAEIILAADYLRTLILSVVITIAYAILSKLLK